MRALVGEPKLLLLDEPSEGIQPSIVQEIARTLRRIVQAKSLTVLLVEQNLELVLGMASRSLFMENGRVVDDSACRPAETEFRTRPKISFGIGTHGLLRSP